ncbi:Hsp20/alpha crystallin family protein [Flaviramulus sp. BrNp1-15]|uniref:Hsp20/alpha crystallin family protein n=1 Tax=Flaviramulus sp. BrNp1-15 TaxID=2916754 RepID=UPI001EE805D8|nr:Hsp20/alpha crystallin family protein [Flaviramulus sp. BrNp1-15]ULC58504.1 Hsp20/alpha crystallin family protein [Flaviramulus sp. BrNp1-15]
MSLSKTQNPNKRRDSGMLSRNHFLNIKPNKGKELSDVKIKETASKFHYELKLPGYIKEDFNFYINNSNDLVVTTDKKYGKSQEDNDGKRHSYCYPSAYFKRRLPLPENVVRNKISVDYKNETLSFDLFKSSN